MENLGNDKEVREECNRLCELLFGHLKPAFAYLFCDTNDWYKRREELVKKCDELNIEWRRS